jgi:hypothetical protein
MRDRRNEQGKMRLLAGSKPDLKFTPKPDLERNNFESTTLVPFRQCCGAETICFGSISGSGSNFQKVSAPALVPTSALKVPVFTAFK